MAGAFIVNAPRNRPKKPVTLVVGVALKIVPRAVSVREKPIPRTVDLEVFRQDG